GNTYQFPEGTDKNAAINYFKKKGIGATASQSTGSKLKEAAFTGIVSPETIEPYVNPVPKGAVAEDITKGNYWKTFRDKFFEGASRDIAKVGSTLTSVGGAALTAAGVAGGIPAMLAGGTAMELGRETQKESGEGARDVASDLL